MSIRRRWLLLAAAAILALLAVEAVRAYRFYDDVTTSKSILTELESGLDLQSLQDSEEEAARRQARLETAAKHLADARSFVRTDPFVNLAGVIPLLGKQADGLKTLVYAGDAAARTGLKAGEVALRFARHERDPSRTSIEDALAFLQAQEPLMAEVDAGLKELQGHSDALPDGLVGPLGRASSQLDRALTKLDGLVQGYKRADQLLPALLGVNGPRRYLLLAQNDTELFPSGGLISSYGIVTFDRGRLTDISLEYFGALYDRWQAQSGKEYVEPPGPLKNYLKRHFSWALGEAGWYPDFPTTAGLARTFVAKGGAPQTDGTIAIDLQFVDGLLGLLGSVYVPDYDVTVTPANVAELTLELTRDESYVPLQEKKAFLSHLAKAMLGQIFAAPKERWVPLLNLLDRMARERHLQLNFMDPSLQALTREYGFDGGLVDAGASDYILIADTSVNSTKLNLILDVKAAIEVQLLEDGSARHRVSYTIRNPFPEWKADRDPELVRQLMLEGVYGCYLRVYTRGDARFGEARVNGSNVGPEQVDLEFERRVFGRFASVLPGATTTIEFTFETPDVVEQGERGDSLYRLYLQKQAGTGAIPVELKVYLPSGAEVRGATLNGAAAGGTNLSTDLSVDRRYELTYELAR